MGALTVRDLLMGTTPFEGAGWIGSYAWMARGDWPGEVHNPLPWPITAINVRAVAADAVRERVEFGERYSGEIRGEVIHRRLASNGRVADADLIDGCEQIADGERLRWAWVEVDVSDLNGAFALVDEDDGALVGLVAPRLRDRHDEKASAALVDGGQGT